MQAGHWAGPAVQPGQSSCAGDGLMWLADAAGGPGEGLGCTAGACLSSQWPPARTKTSQAAPWLGFQDQLSL